MLATLADLKTYLGITDNSSDGALNLILASASAEFESMAGRKFEKDTEDRTEEIDGKGTQDFFLKKYPVSSFVKLETFSAGAWSDVSADAYRVQSTTGTIRLAYPSTPGFSNYRATYRG